uniref:Flap structure-specific endonuclease 1 n=1 Tax=Oryzias sinensis TaxID=183150 RepID=A0A8C7YDB9_9TELE
IQDGNVLQNEDGETTSHLMGMFYRTIRMLEHGIKPLKSSEFEKRGERRAEAEKLLAQAQEMGEQENVEKFTKRLVKVTKQHNDECKKLLSLMGVPYIEVSYFSFFFSYICCILTFVTIFFVLLMFTGSKSTEILNTY